jgi:putative transposase
MRLLSDKPEKARGEVVTRSKFLEDQIADAVRIVKSGTPVVDVYRKVGVYEGCFYTLKNKLGGLEVPDARWVGELKGKNFKPVKLLAKVHSKPHASMRGMLHPSPPMLSVVDLTSGRGGSYDLDLAHGDCGAVMGAPAPAKTYRSV